ncbi:hypothetical protein NQ176_g7253 [Zarea fungicola]|uniref:Uncharacterized protein n=1 Tax=Zarea fungicola TaxID=93591 RepID=A0ACC1MZT1_9HYPO|nr:hypothetical protein NQ176_g7253 [Lecanicillium fungicola]
MPSADRRIMVVMRSSAKPDGEELQSFLNANSNMEFLRLQRQDYSSFAYWNSLRLSIVPENVTVMCALDYVRSGHLKDGDIFPRQTLGKVWNKRETPGQWTSWPFGHYAVASLRDPSYHNVEQFAKHLRSQGVVIKAIHTEGRWGQYEFALGPMPPLEPIDQLILVQSYLKDTFAPRLLATLVPKPIAGDTLATGQHMHLLLQPARIEHQEQSFLASVLGRLPSP